MSPLIIMARTEPRPPSRYDHRHGSFWRQPGRSRDATIDFDLELDRGDKTSGGGFCTGDRGGEREHAETCHSNPPGRRSHISRFQRDDIVVLASLVAPEALSSAAIALAGSISTPMPLV